jgi:hypothetical protein
VRCRRPAPLQHPTAAPHSHATRFGFEARATVLPPGLRARSPLPQPRLSCGVPRRRLPARPAVPRMRPAARHPPPLPPTLMIHTARFWPFPSFIHAIVPLLRPSRRLYVPAAPQKPQAVLYHKGRRSPFVRRRAISLIRLRRTPHALPLSPYYSPAAGSRCCDSDAV